MCTTLKNTILNKVVTSMCKRKCEENECPTKRMKIKNEDNDNVMRRIKLNNHHKEGHQCEATIKRIKIECLNEHMKDLWGCEGINGNNKIEVIDLKTLHEPACKVETVSDDDENGKEKELENKQDENNKNDETSSNSSNDLSKAEPSGEELIQSNCAMNTNIDDIICSNGDKSHLRDGCTSHCLCPSIKNTEKQCSCSNNVNTEICNTASVTGFTSSKQEDKCIMNDADSNGCNECVTEIEDIKDIDFVLGNKSDTEADKNVNSGIKSQKNTNSSTDSDIDTNSGIESNENTISGTGSSKSENSDINKDTIVDTQLVSSNSECDCDDESNYQVPLVHNSHENKKSCVKKSNVVDSNQTNDGCHFHTDNTVLSHSADISHSTNVETKDESKETEMDIFVNGSLNYSDNTYGEESVSEPTKEPNDNQIESDRSADVGYCKSEQHEKCERRVFSDATSDSRTVITNEIHELKYNKSESQRENFHTNSHENRTKACHDKGDKSMHQDKNVKLSHTEWMNRKFKTWPYTESKSESHNCHSSPKSESENNKKSDFGSKLEIRSTPCIPIVKTSDDDIPDSIKNSHLFQLLMKGKQEQALEVSNEGHKTSVVDSSNYYRQNNEVISNDQYTEIDETCKNQESSPVKRHYHNSADSSCSEKLSDNLCGKKGHSNQSVELTSLKQSNTVCKCNEKTFHDVKTDQRKAFLTSLLYKTEERIRNIIESGIHDKDVLSSIVKIEKDTEELENCDMYDGRSSITGDDQYIRQTSYDLPNTTVVKVEKDIDLDSYSVGCPVMADDQYLRQCSSSTSYSDVFSDKENDVSTSSSLVDKDKGQENISDILDLRCKNKDETSVGLDLRLDNKKKEQTTGVTTENEDADYYNFNGFQPNKSNTLHKMKDPVSPAYNASGLSPLFRQGLHPAFGFHNSNTVRNFRSTSFNTDFLVGKSKHFVNERAHRNMDTTRVSGSTIAGVGCNEILDVSKEVNSMCKCDAASEKCNSINISRQHICDISRKRSSSLDTCKDRPKDIPDVLKRPNSNPERCYFLGSKPFTNNSVASEETTDDQDIYIVDSYVSKQPTSENSSAVRRSSDSMYTYTKPDDLSRKSDNSAKTFHQTYLDTLGRNKLGSFDSILKMTNQLKSDISRSIEGQGSKLEVPDKSNAIPSKPPPLTPIESLFFGSEEIIHKNQRNKMNANKTDISPSQQVTTNELTRPIISSNETNRRISAKSVMHLNKPERIVRSCSLKLKNNAIKGKFHRNRRLVQKDLASGMNHTKMPTQSFLLFKQVQKRLKAIAIEFNRNSRDHSACRCDNKDCSPLLKALLQGEISSDAAFNFHYREAVLMKGKKQSERLVKNRLHSTSESGSPNSLKSVASVNDGLEPTMVSRKDVLNIYSPQNGQLTQTKDSINSKSNNSHKELVHEHQRQNGFPRKPKSINTHIDLTQEDSSDENEMSAQKYYKNTWQLSQLSKSRMIQMNELYNENTLHNPNLKQLQLTTDKVFQSQRQNGYIHRTNAVLNSEPSLGKEGGGGTRLFDIDKIIPTPRHQMPNWYMPQNQHIRMNFPMSCMSGDRNIQNMGYIRTSLSNKSCTITRPTDITNNEVRMNAELPKNFYPVNGFPAKPRMMPAMPPPLIPLDFVARK